VETTVQALLEAVDNESPEKNWTMWLGEINKQTKTKTNSVALSPRANYQSLNWERLLELMAFQMNA
jgi:hypothetical protein